jgi:hypothetical protein
MSEVATALGISESNLFKIIKKDSFEVSYLLKAAELMKLPLSYFIDSLPNSSSVTQNGIGNTASGYGNRINVNTNSNPNPSSKADLAARLAECEKERMSLARELDVTRELVKAKDEMILLLRGSRPSN